MSATKSRDGKLKRILLVGVLVLAAFAVYVEIVNRNSKQMTYRQKVLKAVYPVWMWLSRNTGKHKEHLTGNKPAPVSFHTLRATLVNGDTLDFSKLAGKKVLVVNTASGCGYTDQYRELQELYESAKGSLEIIAFPANDFKNQEPGSNEDIVRFCKANFGITFPIAEKTSTLPGPGQHSVFAWLSDPSKNGWNSKPPSWNFSKYLVDGNGTLTHYFGPSVSPSGKEIQQAIEEK